MSPLDVCRLSGDDASSRGPGGATRPAIGVGD
jgi:hypothetical protein